MRPLCLLMLLATPVAAQTRHVIFVTIDGVRSEDIFNGADSNLMSRPKDAGIEDTAAFRARWWRETPVERRRAIMPFLWDTLVPAGVIFGVGDRVRVTNALNFSGPGYTELFTGAARPDVTTNDDRRYAHPTLFEVVARQPGHRGTDVAAFTSWTTQARLTATRDGVFTSQGPFEALPPALADDGVLARLQVIEARVRHDDRSMRYDAFTHELALTWLRRYNPTLLHIGYGETDVEAHARHYDRYLAMLYETDRMLSELIRAVQDDPELTGRTTVVVTTDHGRGATSRDWTDHGREVANAARWWFLASGAGVDPRGVIDVPMTQSQVAPTILQLLGLNADALAAPVASPIALGQGRR